MQIVRVVGVLMVAAMVRSPPQRPSLHGGRAAEREQELPDAVQSKRSVREVAVVAGGDAQQTRPVQHDREQQIARARRSRWRGPARRVRRAAATRSATAHRAAPDGRSGVSVRRSPRGRHSCCEATDETSYELGNNSEQRSVIATSIQVVSGYVELQDAATVHRGSDLGAQPQRTVRLVAGRRGGSRAPRRGNLRGDDERRPSCVLRQSAASQERCGPVFRTIRNVWRVSIASTARELRAQLTTPGALRVPRVIAAFWIIKGLSTAMGESTSDYLVHAIAPELAVVLGFAGFVAALAIQLRMRRYVAWAYWLAVVMVGIFGTMAADVVHVGLGVPYTASTIFYVIVLAAVFAIWSRTEHTLSIHDIDSTRRELLYWATVAATFAMGTALGDFTAYTLHLGYITSAILFAALICVPVVGYRWLRWNAVLCFWLAYVLTRPLGASIADGLANPRHDGGLAWGDGPVVALFGCLIIVMVTYLTVTRADVQTIRNT